MVTLLFTSLFIVAFLVVAIYFWQRAAATPENEPRLTPGPERRSLFDDNSGTRKVVKAEGLSEAKRAGILARGQAGEKSALQDARASGNEDLYVEVLNSLANAAEGPGLLSLTSYVCRNELPVTKRLAIKFVDWWKNAPARNSTAEMLHVAALANDAETYRSAVEAAMAYWRAGQLSAISPDELRAIINGEYWLLSIEARTSGAGFLLKESLANVRRELEAARNNNNSLH